MLKRSIKADSATEADVVEAEAHPVVVEHPEAAEHPEEVAAAPKAEQGP